jgi:putative membrane protein
MGSQSFLDQGESAALEEEIAGLEAQTGVQLVTAVIGKADSYVEPPWKAFALGTAFAGLVLVVAETFLWQRWPGAEDALIFAVAILGAGAASALLAVVAPAYARLFLRATRRDVKVRHYAQAGSW